MRDLKSPIVVAPVEWLGLPHVTSAHSALSKQQILGISVSLFCPEIEEAKCFETFLDFYHTAPILSQCRRGNLQILFKSIEPNALKISQLSAEIGLTSNSCVITFQKSAHNRISFKSKLTFVYKPRAGFEPAVLPICDSLVGVVGNIWFQMKKGRSLEV